jgi:lipopolysaccharide/colanic/teichoic acid biosynthesis glycosyltransferase
MTAAVPAIERAGAAREGYEANRMIDGHVAAADKRLNAKSISDFTSARPSLKLPSMPLPSKRMLRLKLQLFVVALDILCLALAFLISCLARFGAVDDLRAFEYLLLLVPWYLLVAANNRAYDLEALQNPKAAVERAIVALVATAALLAAVLFYLKTSTLFSRQVVGVGVVGSAVFLGLARYTFVASVIGRRRLSLTNDVLLIDGAPLRPQAGEIVIIAGMGASPGWDPLMLHRLGTFLRHADRIIVAASEPRRSGWVAALKGVGVDVEVLATDLEQLGPLGLRRYGPHPTLVVGSKPLGLGDSIKKRALDLAITIPVLIMLAPVFVLVAIAIKLDSRGPIFFRQARLGQGNRIFQILKFRTMCAKSEDSDGACSTGRNDPRITRIGRYLRRTSIDELPQLFNVLVGDMSLVGPRPHALGSTAEETLFWNIEGRYWERHGIKPGITGLAQVRGYRGATETKADVINRVQSDLEYRVGWSLTRDVAIIARTLRVLVHPNAY